MHIHAKHDSQKFQRNWSQQSNQDPFRIGLRLARNSLRAKQPKALPILFKEFLAIMLRMNCAREMIRLID
jgi:hypothetical protein